MTIIAYDGISLATDRQATSGGVRAACSKSMRLRDGTVLAWAGGHAQGLILADLYKRKRLVKAWPDFQTRDGNNFTRLIVARKGYVEFYEQDPAGIPVLERFYAWGSGREIAIGAMAMGATAARAVEIANEWENGCGKGVDNYLL